MSCCHPPPNIKSRLSRAMCVVVYNRIMQPKHALARTYFWLCSGLQWIRRLVPPPQACKRINLICCGWDRMPPQHLERQCNTVMAQLSLQMRVLEQDAAAAAATTACYEGTYVIRKLWFAELCNQLLEPEANHCNKKLCKNNLSQSRMLTAVSVT